MLGDRREFRRWPRVRRLRDGRIRVVGRVRTVERYLFGVRLLHLVLVASAFLLFVSSIQGVLFDYIPEGTIAYSLSMDLLFVRLAFKDLAQALPRVADAVRYTPGHPIDVHIMATAVLVALASRVLFPLGGLTMPPKRFVCTIDSDRIVVRCGLRWITLKRTDLDTPVSIRAVDARTWHSGRAMERIKKASLLGEHAPPPGVLEAVRGSRQHKIVFALRADRTEAIAARCDEALRRTSKLVTANRG